jgi:hypothetical protein
VRRRGGFAVDIELENTGDHDYRWRPISIFEHREHERFYAADEKSVAGTLLFLHHPAPVAVLADKKRQWPRTRHCFTTRLEFGYVTNDKIRSSPR